MIKENVVHTAYVNHCNFVLTKTAVQSVDGRLDSAALLSYIIFWLAVCDCWQGWPKVKWINIICHIIVLPLSLWFIFRSVRAIAFYVSSSMPPFWNRTQVKIVSQSPPLAPQMSMVWAWRTTALTSVEL